MARAQDQENEDVSQTKAIEREKALHQHQSDQQRENRRKIDDIDQQKRKQQSS